MPGAISHSIAALDNNLSLRADIELDPVQKNQWQGNC